MLIVDAVRHVLASGNRNIDFNQLKIDFTKKFVLVEEVEEQDQEELENWVVQKVKATFGLVKGLPEEPVNEYE